MSFKKLILSLMLAACGGGTGPRSVSDCCEIVQANCQPSPNGGCDFLWCDVGSTIFYLGEHPSRLTVWCSTCPLAGVVARARALGANPLACVPWSD